MKEAGFADNEARRLMTLHGLGILDTPREDRFDRYTRIAAQTFGTPMALISLVDQDRQWFKSTVGLDVDETPRDISFCAHAILGDAVFEVRNARRDPRFRDNPLVLESPNIRFYAGAPLKASNGDKLGTLCVIDSEPRQLSSDEMTRLGDLADMVVGEMLKRRDAVSARPDCAAEPVTAVDFFDAIPAEPGSTVLLFDIDDVLTSHGDANSAVCPAEVFTHLLQDHFPTAASIAHVGDYHFCVLLAADEDFDEVRAINHLCSDAKKMLCFADGRGTLAPFVGRVQYCSNKYASVDAMCSHVDRMFRQHEPQPIRDEPVFKSMLKKLASRRKTIF